MAPSNILIYLLRRDLRLEDNPIFHEISRAKDTPYTHLLPLYVFSAQQIEVSGFIPKGSGERSPYPEARSAIGNFWRCGPHRAKFLAESVWDLKTTLEGANSGLEVRVGMLGDVISKILDAFHTKNDNEVQPGQVGGVWLTGEEGEEEKEEENDVKAVCEKAGIEFRIFRDEKYFIDDRDIPFDKATDLPDVFTTYRKMVEPLRDAPRALLPTPAKLSLPPFPPASLIPPQHMPFIIPSSYPDLESALISPVLDASLSNPPQMPQNTFSAHPFHGGAKPGHARVQHLIRSSSVTAYKASRNGLLGPDFSTKLSAWLALGCVTARQVHHALLEFENGETELGSEAEGYGKGENEGTKAVRFELLWRDYMRLCTRKFGIRLFLIHGFKGHKTHHWKDTSSDIVTKRIMERFLEGTTGMGLIDASQRELYLTGYTSNRARQNVASFLAKHLQLDWRLGAEWYECMLVDYDVSSNWGNWQYVAGVGNDPRGEARVFNPVKQAWDYDPEAAYVKGWIPELHSISDPGQCFQAWTVPEKKRAELSLAGLEWVEQPLIKINFVKGPGRHGGGNRGADRDGGSGSRDGDGRRPHRGSRGQFRGNPHGSRGYHSGRGGGGTYGGSSRPYYGGGRGRGRGRNRRGGGGGGGGEGQALEGQGRETPPDDVEKETSAP